MEERPPPPEGGVSGGLWGGLREEPAASRSLEPPPSSSSSILEEPIHSSSLRRDPKGGPGERGWCFFGLVLSRGAGFFHHPLLAGPPFGASKFLGLVLPLVRDRGPLHAGRSGPQRCAPHSVPKLRVGVAIFTSTRSCATNGNIKDARHSRQGPPKELVMPGRRPSGARIDSPAGG